MAGLVENSRPTNPPPPEILDIAERIQQQIGQDLHDGPCQILTGIKFLSRALMDHLSAKSLEEAEAAAEINSLVCQALSEVDEICRGLYSIDLEARGILAALQNFVAQISKRFKIDCRVESAPDFVLNNPNRVLQIYRIAQEAVHNAVKHGKASRILVKLRGDPSFVDLSIEDNGSGFKPSPRDGLGLHIMNYRAELLGTSLIIRNLPEGGTQVSCTFLTGDDIDA